jgi:hypothetical protein
MAVNYFTPCRYTINIDTFFFLEINPQTECSFCLSADPSINPSVHLFVSPSIRVDLSICCFSVFLPLRLSIHEAGPFLRSRQFLKCPRYPPLFMQQGYYRVHKGLSLFLILSPLNLIHAQKPHVLGSSLICSSYLYSGLLSGRFVTEFRIKI